MAITIDDIEALRRHLAELPRNQPREVTKQEAITLLAAELGAAKRRGYSPEELARLLSENGIGINAATLRGYLRRTRKARRQRGGKTPARETRSVTPTQRSGGDSPPVHSSAPSASPGLVRSAPVGAPNPPAAASRSASEAGGAKVPGAAKDRGAPEG